MPFSQQKFWVGKAQVIITVTMYLFYSSVPLNHDSMPACTIPGLCDWSTVILLFTALLFLPWHVKMSSMKMAHKAMQHTSAVKLRLWGFKLSNKTDVTTCTQKASFVKRASLFFRGDFASHVSTVCFCLKIYESL